MEVFRKDSPGSLTTVDGELTSLQVDANGSVRFTATSLPLPTGAATEATLAAINAKLPAALVGGRLDVVIGAALPAGANNIGDVDVLTVPAPLNVVGGGAEATALRVTIANDSTGVLSVDDNGASLTIDSTQLPAALVGGRLDVVVGAALPAGGNNIGDVDVLSLPTTSTVPTGSELGTIVRNLPGRSNWTAAAPAAVSVGVASALAVVTNTSRKGPFLRNTSNNIISIAFGAATPAVLNSGITLFSGDAFVMDEHSFTTVQVNAIASVAASNLAVQDYT